MNMTTLLPVCDEDPLVTAVERFPLAWPRFSQPTSVEPVSPEGVRPFGLRFAVELVGRPLSLPSWRYDDDR